MKSSLMSATSDSKIVGAWGTGLRKLLRLHPNAAGKNTMIILGCFPGTQEEGVIVCTSQVSCHCPPTFLDLNPMSI